MLCLFFRVIPALALVLLASACATVPSSPFGTMGAVNRHADGSSFTVYNRAGDNDFSAVTYVVPQTCFGRQLAVSVEYRTSALAGGTSSFHGVHVDYDMRHQGVTRYPLDYLADPAPHWQQVSRLWFIPADASRVIVRFGLQGMTGRMDVRNIQVAC
ncbi:MAG: hypothetical protein KBD27_00960 [Candidatus Moranbacteria bacterium]|nr:hypothetical protein [Candidatus Moranbacteria bacterium]